MHGENNIFVRHLKTLPAPWHHKVHNPGSNHRTDVIVDYHSNEVAHMVKFAPHMTSEQYRRSIDLIEHAPELLAACIEYAMLQDAAGTLTESLAQLILNAGGPDIRERVSPTATELPAEKIKETTPQTKDNVLRTKTKKGRPLQR